MPHNECTIVFDGNEFTGERLKTDIAGVSCITCSFRTDDYAGRHGQTETWARFTVTIDHRNSGSDRAAVARSTNRNVDKNHMDAGQERGGQVTDQ